MLSRIERDVVLRSLQEEGSPLVLSAGTEHMPVANGRYRIHNMKITVPDIAFPVPLSSVPQPVRVGFYYKKRGMYFTGNCIRYETGIQIIIPPDIYRQSDAEETSSRMFTGTVCIGKTEKTGRDGRTDTFICRASDDFSLTTPELWKMVPAYPDDRFYELLRRLVRENMPLITDMQTVPADSDPGDTESRIPAVAKVLSSSRKMLLVRAGKPASVPFEIPAFVSRGDTAAAGMEYAVFAQSVSRLPDSVYVPLFSPGSPGPHHIVSFVLKENMSDEDVRAAVETVLCLFPVCRYLLREGASTKAVQGRAEPFAILLLTDFCIILGSAEKFPFGGSDSLTVRLSAGIRSLNLECRSSFIYSYETRNCAVCFFETVKEEDLRFLYENYYGKMYT